MKDQLFLSLLETCVDFYTDRQIEKKTGQECGSKKRDHPKVFSFSMWLARGVEFQDLSSALHAAAAAAIIGQGSKTRCDSV